jgi:D-sedoheptulose 7-phosphate isomerase
MPDVKKAWDVIGKVTEEVNISEKQRSKLKKAVALLRRNIASASKYLHPPIKGLSKPQKVEFRKKIIRGYFDDSQKILEETLKKNVDNIEKAARELARAYYEDKQIITMGNGGAAPIASHAAADFSKSWTGKKLIRIKSFSLVDNVSLLTSWMNDAGIDNMFVGQLETILNPMDIVIGISASGNSKNVVNAIKYANKIGAVTIGLCGFDGGELRREAKIAIHIPSNSFKHVEDIQGFTCHLLKAVVINEIKTKPERLTD